MFHHSPRGSTPIEQRRDCVSLAWASEARTLVKMSATLFLPETKTKTTTRQKSLLRKSFNTMATKALRTKVWRIATNVQS